MESLTQSPSLDAYNKSISLEHILVSLLNNSTCKTGIIIVSTRLLCGLNELSNIKCQIVPDKYSTNYETVPL